MPTARREHFGYLLEPGLTEIFYNAYDELPTIAPELFDMKTTDKPYETDVGIGDMGDFPEFEGTVEYDRPYEQYKKTYEFPEFAKGFRIERKLWDDDRYNEINKQPIGLALSAARRREKDAALIFNNAFDSNYTGGDGKELCASDHPSKAPDGPATRSNAGTLGLNHETLETTRLLMRATKNDRGEQIYVNPDTLLVPPALEEMAWSLIESETRTSAKSDGAGEAQSNPNIHQGKYKLIVWDRLTQSSDTDGNGNNKSPWFLIDSKYMKMFLKWYDRVPLEFAMEEDFDSLVAKFRAYMRYNAGWSDWIWVYGQAGSSGTT